MAALELIMWMMNLSKKTRQLRALGCSALIALAMTSCATTPRASARSAQGFIRLDVTPQDARVYIDEQYQGEVQGWMHQTIAVKPGQRRLGLRAKGYMTQRFDLRVEEGEVVTLSLRMERELEVLDPPKTSPQASGRKRTR